MIGFPFLLRLNNIPLYVYTTFRLPILPLMDIWVDPISWLLWMILPMGWNKGLISFLRMWMSSFLNTTCWRDCFCSHWVILTLIEGHLTMYLGVCFLAFYLVPLVYVSVIMAVPCCVNYCNFTICLKSGNVSNLLSKGINESTKLLKALALVA